MLVLELSTLWTQKFNQESSLIQKVLGDSVLDIQHIGSTSIPGIMTKPIIDIMVAIPSIENAETFVEPLMQIGYKYFPESSSQERLFFRKGNPPRIHLSLAQKNKFDYWVRQVLFRDYLCTHPEVAREYESLKLKLIEQNPTGQIGYIQGKGEFVKKVLQKAEGEQS